MPRKHLLQVLPLQHQPCKPLAAALDEPPASGKVLAVAGIAQSGQILYHICK